MRRELGKLSDIAAVEALLSAAGLSVAGLSVAGLSVVDVGCGPGASSRELAARGALVLAVEPDPVQAEKNRTAPPTQGVTFVEAGAEALPAETGAVDGVFFFRSLHHVPGERMDAALTEAARVLKPESGFLYIAEPAMTGSHFAVMRTFFDETEVRNLAQAALARTATALFGAQEAALYSQRPRYDSFEAFVTRVTGQTFNDIDREQVEREDVRALFEAGRAEAGDAEDAEEGGYVFEQPMLVDLYRGPIPAP